jgi:hypothetical protein
VRSPKFQNTTTPQTNVVLPAELVADEPAASEDGALEAPPSRIDARVAEVQVEPLVRG